MNRLEVVPADAFFSAETSGRDRPYSLLISVHNGSDRSWGRSPKGKLFRLSFVFALSRDDTTVVSAIAGQICEMNDEKLNFSAFIRLNGKWDGTPSSYRGLHYFCMMKWMNTSQLLPNTWCWCCKIRNKNIRLLSKCYNVLNQADTVILIDLW